MDGLLHITDMTWGRLGHPSELLKVGQQLDVIVLDINKEKERVSLGLKQTQKNPWDQIEERFPAGQQVKGKITNLVPYGAFVELEEGVEGLIHVSELSWTKRIMRPSDILTVGQEVEAVVLGVNKEEQKISLGLRQLEPNPWDEIEKKFTIGSTRQRPDSQHDRLRRVRGTRRRHRRNDPRLRSELDAQDQSSDAKSLRRTTKSKREVIDIDKTNQRISLGIKQLSDDPWKNIDQKYKIGDLVTGKVTKLASFGAFVQLQDDIDGLVHISQLSEDHVAKVKDVLKVGQEVEARVIKVDKVERRIGLSIKAANYSEEELRTRIRSVRQPASGRRHGRPRESVRSRRGRLSPRRSARRSSASAILPTRQSTAFCKIRGPLPSDCGIDFFEAPNEIEDFATCDGPPAAAQKCVRQPNGRSS